VDQCPVEGGFRLRGMDITRVEVFVDAAFAFAVTLLVVSVDAIPRNFGEMVGALKGLPAFAAAVAQLAWIWHAHCTWSRRFGLEDAVTVLLSTTLLIVVLTWIYPLRVMAQGMFSWFTGDWLPASFELASIAELKAMFVILGLGFFFLCGLFTLLYGWALRRAAELRLDAAERFEALTVGITWLGSGVCGLLTALAALSLPLQWVPFSGFAFAFIGAWIPWFHAHRARRKPAASFATG
jgi:hypothetical protein